MIVHCPGCGYFMIAEIGCSNCGYTNFPKEVNDQNDKRESRKVGKAAGEDMPSPAVQLNLHFV
jgi:hypothetical protein